MAAMEDVILVLIHFPIVRNLIKARVGHRPIDPIVHPQMSRSLFPTINHHSPE